MCDSILSANGSIETIESTGGNQGPFRSQTPPLWDYGPHDLAMVDEILKCEPDDIQATYDTSASSEMGRIYDTHLIHDQIQSRLKFGNGFSSRVRKLRVIKGGRAFHFDDDGLNHQPLPHVVQTFLEGVNGHLTSQWGLESSLRITKTLSRIEQALT